VSRIVLDLAHQPAQGLRRTFEKLHEDLSAVSEQTRDLIAPIVALGDLQNSTELSRIELRLSLTAVTQVYEILVRSHLQTSAGCGPIGLLSVSSVGEYVDTPVPAAQTHRMVWAILHAFKR
jgi:hypothetical protein